MTLTSTNARVPVATNLFSGATSQDKSKKPRQDQSSVTIARVRWNNYLRVRAADEIDSVDENESAKGSCILIQSR